MILFRRPAQLAVQTALLLALQPEGSCRRVRDIAAALRVPTTYLTKVLHDLRRSGLLGAVRGPGGGVQLTRPAREIHLWDVLSALEPQIDFQLCFLGLERCSDRDPCPLDKAWAPLRNEIIGVLQTKNLQELASEAHTSGMLGWEPTDRNANGQGSPCAACQP